MAELHPDKAGPQGQFASQRDAQSYHELQSALDFIDTQNARDASRPLDSTALVPIAQVGAMIEQALRAQAIARGDDTTRRRAFLAEARTSFREAAFVPKITSGGIAAFIGGLWAFSGQLQDNPIFGQFVKPADPIFLVATAEIFLVSGALFLFVWHYERRLESWAEVMTSEEGVQLMANGLRQKPNAQSFTRMELSAGVRASFYNRGRPDVWSSRPAPPGRTLRRFLGLRVSPAVVDEIAELIISRLESRGAIRRTRSNALDPTYEFLDSNPEEAAT